LLSSPSSSGGHYYPFPSCISEGPMVQRTNYGGSDKDGKLTLSEALTLIPMTPTTFELVMRRAIVAFMLSIYVSTSASAQVRCFEGWAQIKIDYGRSLASSYGEWFPAQITESTVAWTDDTSRSRTSAFLFDRYNGRVRQHDEFKEPYTNRPWSSGWQNL